MRNIKELREELVNVYDGLKVGVIEIKKASEMNNTAGKIIRSLAVQLNYFSLRKEAPKIKFLESNE